MKQDIIRGLPIFSSLPESEIDFLARTLLECSVPAGEVLFLEGTFSDQFYILLDGEVEIIKSLNTNDERLLDINSRGAVLGEMSMFNETGSHTASVRAHTPLSLLAMTRAQFDDLLHRRPELSYNLLRLFSRRLEGTENAVIRDLREKNRQLTQAYQELQAAQAQMIEKERLEKELDIAAEFQRSILPPTVPVYPGLDISAMMVPARVVGGDFYDFIPLDSDHLGIVVGDVVDKGMPAALFMTLAYSSIRTEAVRGYTPGDALRAVNEHLLSVNRSGMFVTLVYGILDCVTHRFSYARAGHPHPLILDGNNRPVQVPSTIGQPVGLFHSIRLDEQSLVLPSGGKMLIFSDGLDESLEARNPDFSLEGLAFSLLDGRDLTAQQFCAGLWGVVEGAQSGEPLLDDFTVVAVKAGAP